MKLYYSKGACSLVIRIVLNEMGIPFESEAVDLLVKKTASGVDFYTINPKGQVPTIVLDNKEVLTENVVIQQYLVDTYKNTELLPDKSDFQHYRVLELSNFITTEIHKGFGPLFNPEVPQELKDKLFIPFLKKKFDLLDKKLEGRTFLAADHFTLPDAYLYVMLMWWRAFKVDLNTWKNFPDYFARIKARPAVQASLHEEGLKG